MPGIYNTCTHVHARQVGGCALIMRLRRLSGPGPSDITSGSGGNCDTPVKRPIKYSLYFMYKMLLC